MRPTYSWQKVPVEIAVTPVVRHVTRTLVAPDGTRHRIRVPVYGRPVLASRDDPVEIVTALAPVIGHDAAAQIAEEAFSTGRSVRELCLERKLVAPKELERLLDPRSQTQPRA